MFTTIYSREKVGNVIYSNMHTMKSEKGLLIGEILWNHNKGCYSIRNYLTLKFTDYKTREDMKKAWTKLKEYVMTRYGIKVEEC